MLEKRYNADRQRIEQLRRFYYRLEAANRLWAYSQPSPTDSNYWQRKWKKERN